jgi:hypothetical protein
MTDRLAKLIYWAILGGVFVLFLVSVVRCIRVGCLDA